MTQSIAGDPDNTSPYIFLTVNANFFSEHRAFITEKLATECFCQVQSVW